MRPRVGAVLVLVILAVAVGLSLLAGRLKRERAPGTVILVTVDTLRADRLSAWGGAGNLTPRMDALGARGTVFTRTWTTAPLTVPAHVSALTGLLPPVHGLRTNRAGRLPPRAGRPYATVAESFRGGDLRTAAFVSSAVLRDDRTGLAAGFDVYDEPPPTAKGALHDSERRGADTVALALDWLLGDPSPAFLWVHLFDPHVPYDPPEPFSVPPEQRTTAAGYDADVAYADHVVGLLLDGLKDTPHERAAIVLTADHGEALGEHGEATHGYLLHRSTVEVPLIVVAPGRVDSGRVRDDPTSIADVAPTLLALADLPVPQTMGGRPLFAGGTARMTRVPYAETIYAWDSFRWARLHGLRDGERAVVDTGRELLVFDHRADPGEARPVRHPKGERLPADLVPLAELVAAEAGRQPVASTLDPPPALAAGSYWSGGGLPDHEPSDPGDSPYDRIGLVGRMDAARGLLARGDPAAAAGEFASVRAEDPSNPEAAFWHARCLERTGEQADLPRAAAAYRDALDLGRLTTDCLAKALQLGVRAGRDAGDEAAASASLSSLERSLSKGVRADGACWYFAALLHAAEGDPEAARGALGNARREPLGTALEQAVRELEHTLR